MFYRIIRNDFANSKFTSLIITLFVAAAAMLVALAAILAVNLFGAIDNLMTQAKTPHFLQMHTGDLNRDRLASFAQSSPDVEQFQVTEFLNVDSSRIVIGEQSLANSVQDNGFTVQNEHFDYLLGQDGGIIHPAPGELYVPIGYGKSGLAQIGDTADIAGVPLTVAGFLRDSQMNSPLASSKRFLVHPADYAQLVESGRTEYLIMFRLHDQAQLAHFEAAYLDANLEANGPTITYPLFRMVNALSDGLMIAVILLISTMVTAIALLCIRFTLLTRMTEDYREIGVMKAIGLPLADIRRMYMAKYATMAAGGSLLGLLLAWFLHGLLLENIRLFIGESDSITLSLILALGGIVLIFMGILAFVRFTLRRFGRISAAQALRFGSATDATALSGRIRLTRNPWLGVNLFMSMKDILAQKRLYATMLTVLILAVFIAIVPHNLYSTVSSDQFVRYMGIGQSQLRMDMQQNKQLASHTASIAQALANDPDVSRYAVLVTKHFQVEPEPGQRARLKIELGKHDIFPISYFAGKAPLSSDEIALSAIYAKEWKKAVGDTLTVIIDGEPRQLTISGLYSDVTNGGKTAKAAFEDHSAAAMWSVISIDLTDRTALNSKQSEYAARFPEAKVTDISGYINQTFGATIRSIQLAAHTGLAISILLAMLVTVLFMRLLIVKDKRAIAILQALGFTVKDIARQYVYRALMILLPGLAGGIVLANTLGEGLAGQLIASMGGSAFSFDIDPIAAYLLLPGAVALAVWITTVLSTRKAASLAQFDPIKEQS